MSVGVANRTLAAIVAESARISGYWRNAGTATAGTTQTLTDATNERTPVVEANSLTGDFLYSTGGTGAGDEHELTAYGTIGVMGWNTAGTAPTTSTTWVRMGIRPQLILDAIAEVTRLAWRKQAIPFTFTGLVTNSLLEFFGDLEIWGDGASSAPTGYSLGGAGASVARETVSSNADGTPSGVYHAALTAGGGAVGTLTFTVEAKYLPMIYGQSLTLYGNILEAAAGEGVIRVTTTNSANVDTNTDKTGTYAGNWEFLNDTSGTSVSCPNPITNLSVQLRSAISATTRFDDLMLLGPNIYSYSLPASFIGLEPTIYMESGFRSKAFTIPLRFGADWVVRRRESAPSTDKYANDVIHFLRPLPSGRHLRVSGYVAPSVQTTATSNVDPNPSWLALASALQIVEQFGPGNDNVSADNLRKRLTAMEATSEGNTLKGIPFIPIESR